MSGQLGNSAESDLLKLLFQNTAWAGIGDVSGLQPSATAGSFFSALHTASPGAAGTQLTNEAGYTNYTRQAVARSSAGWTITGSSPTTSENAAAITFPQSGSTETETDMSLGKSSSGAGEILWLGPLNANLNVANLITPSYAINALKLQLL